jgi:hypothetical protein
MDLPKDIPVGHGSSYLKALLLLLLVCSPIDMYTYVAHGVLTR